MAQKKVSSKESPFLKTAAEAIGTTLGKLALKTGVVTPPAKSVTKRPKAAPKKRAVASKKVGATSTAKKAAKKNSR